MRFWKTIVMAGAGAALLLPVVTANAADLLQPIVPVIPQPQAVPQPIGGNWYLRGDVGYKIFAEPKVSYGGTAYVNNNIADTGLVGAGVGYRFNPWLRGDITGDYEFPARFHGHLACGGCGGGLSNEYANISAATFLANAYFDLGTWYGITPYVGAGVGASYVMVDHYHFINPVGAVPATGTVPSNGTWNFAWALMAGLSYQISPDLALDLNYRYLALGDAETKPYTAGGVTGPVKFKDLAAHEIRVGLRYQFN
jgi:opacity protein-like surface antigen